MFFGFFFGIVKTTWQSSLDAFHSPESGKVGGYLTMLEIYFSKGIILPHR